VECEQGAIICLQEISHLWAGALTTYFSKKKYLFTTALYGNKFNGYMGVAMAVPMNKYNVLDVDITRVADTKKHFKVTKVNDNIFNTWIKMFKRAFWKPLTKVFLLFGGSKPTQVDPWKFSLSKSNQMISMTMAPQGIADADIESSSFVVGTYHMPCSFWLPSAMTIHCALSAQHISRYANGKPFVFCGDFNIKPIDAMYHMMSNGKLADESSIESPMPFTPVDDPWKPRLDQPLVSAYAAASIAQGGCNDEFNDMMAEPDFTNYAQIRNEEPFIDTLDYIWLGNQPQPINDGDNVDNVDNEDGSDVTSPSAKKHWKEWKIQSVKPLQHRDELDTQGPYPAAGEPSDHVLLSANLELVTKGVM
jgi:2',5'-phosphodiesterase